MAGRKRARGVWRRSAASPAFIEPPCFGCGRPAVRIARAKVVGHAPGEVRALLCEVCCSSFAWRSAFLAAFRAGKFGDDALFGWLRVDLCFEGLPLDVTIVLFKRDDEAGESGFNGSEFLFGFCHA
jgi:hypothetical protein